MRILSTIILCTVAACSSSTTSDGGPGDSGAPIDGSAHDAGPPVDAAIDSHVPPGDGGDVVMCGTGTASTFPTFDRACGSDSDCTIAMHLTDCCGSLDALGIASSEQARFGAAEAACDAMYPACGCDSGSVMADDGSSAPPGSGPAAIVVHCLASVCTTTVRPATPCGSATCTPTQVCVMECSGIPRPDAGPLPSHCVEVPPACATSSSCSCFGAASSCPTGMCQSVSHGAPLCRCA